jgi:hypothetical protein
MRLTTSHRQDLEAQLIALAPQLGDDELRVLVLLVRRVLAGQRRYGHLDLANDPRAFGREALEEVADGLFYLAAAILRIDKKYAGTAAAAAPARRGRK